MNIDKNDFKNNIYNAVENVISGGGNFKKKFILYNLIII